MKSKSIYINLDRVPERRVFMQSQFQKVGLNSVDRFSAIDAKACGALAEAGFRSGIGDRWALPKSAIACFESHRAVWRLAADHDLDAVLIMEDDVVLSNKLTAALRKLFKAASEFDVMKLDYSAEIIRFGPIARSEDLTWRPLLQRATSSGAYVVSRSGLRKLLVRSQNYGDTLDDFLYTPHEDWRIHQLFPALAVQLMSTKTLAAQQSHLSLQKGERQLDPQINAPDLPRGPSWFRLRKELRRFGRRLSWKYGGKAALLRKGGYYGFIPMSEDLKDL